MLSELAKEAAFGKTPGSLCCQAFKYMVMIQMSHYVNETVRWSTLQSLLLGMGSKMHSLAGMTWLNLWMLVGSLPCMNPTAWVPWCLVTRLLVCFHRECWAV